jgi:ABC-2 type transport system permease protein
MFLFLLPAIILSGFLYPIDTMPAFFQHLTLINPLRHFLWVVRAIFLKGAGLGDLWREIGILAVMAVGGMVLSVGRLKGMRAG